MKKHIIFLILITILLTACTPKNYRDSSYCETDDDCKLFSAACGGRYTQNIYYKEPKDIDCRAIVYKGELNLVVEEAICENNQCTKKIYSEETCAVINKMVADSNYSKEQLDMMKNETISLLQFTYHDFTCD